MNIPIKSVIMTIGPTGCGKSTFIKDQLVPQLRALVPNANIQVISSDSYRQELLDQKLDKHDDRMGYASEGAFKLMNMKLEAATTWPVSADFVILDATFLSEKSREQFIAKSKEINYQLVGLCFDFNDREDYFEGNDSSRAYTIGQHLKRFKTETLPEIRRRDFAHFYKVKGKKTPLTLESDPSYDLRRLATLPKLSQYFIVGDIHGCLTEFKALLTSIGFVIEADAIKGKEDTLIVLAGDLVDKGNEVNELMDFLTINKARIRMVIGNHDHALMRFITNNENDRAKDERVAKYFDAFAKMNDVSKAQFMALMAESTYFLLHDHFVVTHAPCRNNDIGKVAPHSLKNQGNCSYGWRRDFDSDEAFMEGVKKSVHWVFDEAKKYDPYHYFGHIAVTEPTVFGNKVFLDTGCAYGNKLSGALFNVHTKKNIFKSVQSSVPKDTTVGDITNFHLTRAPKHSFESLDFEDKMDVVRHARNKVNFISGTMSPCAASLENRTLEDISEAFAYYRSKGVTNVMLQKKYMGSRATMYLFPKDLSKSYMTSRNGFVIKKLDLSAVYAKIKEQINWTFIDKFELLIIDGELMPWSALGRGLIDTHFVTAGKGAASEFDMLTETGFEQALADMNLKFDASEFKKLKQVNKKEDLMKLMGEGPYRLMSAFDGFKWIPIEKQSEFVKIYNKQLDLYGNEGELDFKPFAILKSVDENGVEHTYSDMPQDAIFKMVSQDNYYQVSTAEGPHGVDAARKWFEDRVAEGYEGIVVKPQQVYAPGIAPYVKVRNPNYLTIIYGYDYLIEPKFTRMLEKKNISGKLKMSIKEFELGKKMLEIPYAEINENNVAYLDLCAQMVVEEKFEKTLDPRL